MQLTSNTKIFVAGHNGMLGSGVVRALNRKNYSNLLTISRQELDLKDTKAVRSFLEKEKPEVVIITAAKVGGIQANISYPVEFLYDNLMIQNNLIYESFKAGVKKIVFPGSSCIYPKDCPQPMKEEYVHTGPLEPTNEGYAMAKLAGIKLLQSLHSQYGLSGVNIMPCNLYGTNDSFDAVNAHVLTALIRKFVEAEANNDPVVTLWGTGIARREFMHVDDAAEATVYFMENHTTPDIINIGWGTDLTIRELAEKIAAFTGYQGTIQWDAEKPNGMLRKCMDVSKMKQAGFVPKISLDEGIRKTILEYKEIRKNKVV